MILTLLATIGSAIAAAGTTVATTAAAIGTTVAAGAAAAGGAIAAGAGAVAAAATSTTGLAILGTAAAGTIVGVAHDSGFESGKTEGEKIGYAKASEVYEKVFQRLRAQLNKANLTISEQRGYIADLRALNNELAEAIRQYRNRGNDVSSMELTRYNASHLLAKFAA